MGHSSNGPQTVRHTIRSTFERRMSSAQNFFPWSKFYLLVGRLVDRLAIVGYRIDVEKHDFRFGRVRSGSSEENSNQNMKVQICQNFRKLESKHKSTNMSTKRSLLKQMWDTSTKGCHHQDSNRQLLDKKPDALTTR